MVIGGLQKITLLDFPEKLASIVFTSGCDFRCPYCHNSDLITGNNITPLPLCDFWDFLEKRKAMLEGICITGGEPLLQADILDFISEIKSRNLAVKIDTNGNNPDILGKIVRDHLVDYIAMDVKNSPEKYQITTGIKPDVQAIGKSISLIKNGTIPYEFRTTVVEELHTESDIEAIGHWVEGAQLHYLQQYKDAETVLQHGFSSPDMNKMEKFKQQLEKYVIKVGIR